MTGLDTNILIRYLTQDDPKQAKRATRILENELTKEAPGFVGSFVLVEMCWVLSRLYEVEKSTILQIIEELLGAENVVLENREDAWRALRMARVENLDFADSLLGCINRRFGCDQTLTFDKKAARSELFQLV